MQRSAWNPVETFDQKYPETKQLQLKFSWSEPNKTMTGNMWHLIKSWCDMTQLSHVSPNLAVSSAAESLTRQQVLASVATALIKCLAMVSTCAWAMRPGIQAQASWSSSSIERDPPAPLAAVRGKLSTWWLCLERLHARATLKLFCPAAIPYELFHTNGKTIAMIFKNNWNQWPTCHGTVSG